MSTETVSNNPLVLPAGVRLVSHAVGCAAIYLASHRVLARLRALRRLQLPLDTSDELDRGVESSSAHESSEKADSKAIKEEAEIESLIGSPTIRDSHGGGSLINARVKERRSSERLENGSVDEDGAVIPVNSSNDQNSIAGKDGEGKEHKEKKPVTKAEKIRTFIGITAIVIMFAVLIFGLISLTGYLGGFPEKMKEYVTWVYALPMVYLIASWFAEASYAFSPVRASARYVHRKPVNKKDPFAIKWELYGPDGEPVYVPGAVERGHAQVKEPQATFWYRADIRRMFGAIGAMACIASAYNERKEYIPFLVLTVVLAMTDSSSSFAKKWKMKWCLLVVGSLVALTITALGVCFLVEAYKKPSPPSEPKKRSGTFPLEDWLLPINSAGSFAMPYILPAHLIMIYHRYEDSLLYPLTRSLPPGAPTKVTRFETSRHPRTTFSVITLFVFMRTVAWLEVNYPWQHPKSRESNYFMVEFLGGSVLIFLLQVLICIKRGELKAWWRYTEIWCPSAKDQVDGVDGFTTATDTDEKFPLIDTIEDMSSTEKQRFPL